MLLGVFGCNVREILQFPRLFCLPEHCKDIDIGHYFIDDVMKCLKEGFGKVLDDTQMHPSFCL